MTVSEHGQARRHGFERGHMGAVFERRFGSVDKETMPSENLLQIVPIARRIYAGQIVVALHGRHGQIGGAGGERNDIFIKAPRTSLQMGDRDDVRSDHAHVWRNRAAEFVRRCRRVLIKNHSAQSSVNHQQARAFQRFHVA